MKFLIYIIFSLIKNVYGGFEINKTLDSLYLAQSVYCPQATEKNWTCKYCMNNIIPEKIIENNGAKALLGYHTKYDSLFVAFRGSENIQNWLQDIRIEFIYPYNNSKDSMIKWENIGIEKGFYTIYKYLEQLILDELEVLSIKYGTYKVLTTGHSLGSISTLLAFNIFYFYPKYYVDSDITFGSPRIGNQEFVNAFKYTNVNSSRITHYFDIVPHLPEQFLGYVHIPTEVWFNKKNTEYKICDDNLYEDETCSNSCSPFYCNSINDHLNYIGVNMGSNGDC